MMQIKLTAFILLCLASAVQAQILVTGKIIHAEADNVLLFNVPYENWYYRENTVKVKPDSKGEFLVKLNIKQPQIFFMRFGKTQVHLYGEPNKTLFIQFDALQPDRMEVKGDLGMENTFRNNIGLTWNTLFPESWNNTITPPAKIFSLIQRNQQRALDKLDGLRSETSAAFRRITRADIQYFAISKLWDIFFTLHHQKVKPDIVEWTEALACAYNAGSLSEDDAQESYNYQNAVTHYPRYIQMKGGKSFAEKLLKMPFDSIRAKGERHLKYKLYEYGLEGRSLERAKASFIIHGIYQGEMSYLSEAYDDFQKRFPSSPYKSKVNEAIQPYLDMKEKETSIKFITDDRYKTIADIISSHKGRVVYIDMWGTWCSPCREQFKYSTALKDRFKNEPVDFVYVAIERTDGREKVWKETVSFYHVTGKHILAGKELETSFKDLYQKDGGKNLIFPSYLLVDRNGVLVTSHASHPSSGERLYDEIAAVLRQK